MIGFDLSALDGLTERLARMGDVVELYKGRGQAQRALEAALADSVVIAARQRVRSSRSPSPLRSAIDARVEIDPVKESVATVGVSYKRHKQARHAHLVEYGHGGPHGPAAPHPFWAPAVAERGEEALDLLAAITYNLLGEEWEKK